MLKLAAAVQRINAAIQRAHGRGKCGYCRCELSELPFFLRQRVMDHVHFDENLRRVLFPHGLNALKRYRPRRVPSTRSALPVFEDHHLFTVFFVLIAYISAGLEPLAERLCAAFQVSHMRPARYKLPHIGRYAGIRARNKVAYFVLGVYLRRMINDAHGTIGYDSAAGWALKRFATLHFDAKKAQIL